MKKIQLALVSVTALLLPVLALAQMEGVAPGGYGTPPSSLVALVHSIENLMGTIFGAVAVIAFLISGVLFLTAGGDPEKVQMARSAFIWGIAGVVVGIIAFSIVAIVGSIIR
jgi:hypothetical protein